MSKHVVELTCGDPKSNQQTASKVECVVNITNNNSEKPKRIELDDTTDVYISEEEPEEKSEKPQPSRVRFNNRSSDSLKLFRPIKRATRDGPAVAEGFIQTSSRPTITAGEIINSVEVKDVLLKAFTTILSKNDCLLTSQLHAAYLEDKRLIVLDLADLKSLIGTVVRLVDPEFTDEEVRVKVVVNDIEVGCCGLFKEKKPTLVKPFNEIASISLGDQDLRIHQFEAYNTIEEKLNVSLTYVYSTQKDANVNE